MEIPCKFVDTYYFSMKKKFYTCEFLKQEFLEPKTISVNGKHEESRTDQDVQCVKFQNCNVPKVPQGLTKIFPNLKGIWIENSKLEQVLKDDIAEYKNLEMFASILNDVDVLAGNVFEGFDNLEMISFNLNGIKVIEPNILDGLNKLKYVDFRCNNSNDGFYASSGEAEYSKIADLKADLFKVFSFWKKSLKTKAQNWENSKEKLSEKEENYNKIIGENLDLKNSEKKLKQEIENLNKKHFLLTDIQNFLNNPKYSDLQIEIDDNKYKVHKFLLAARSPTLAEKFHSNPDAENLNLPEVSVEIFEIILHFLYTDELPNDEGTNYVQLYGAASLLKINLLINFAEQKILENINQENAVEVLVLSNKFKNDKVRQKAFDEIKKAHPDLSDNWIDKTDKVKKFIEVFGEN